MRNPPPRHSLPRHIGWRGRDDMANSTKPLRGLLFAFVVAALAIGGMMYAFSERTGAPDQVPLTGADMTSPEDRAN